jgi:hypothetical protein
VIVDDKDSQVGLLHATSIAPGGVA